MSDHLSFETLAAFVDSDVPDEAARIHLENCAECRAHLDAMAAMASALMEMPDVDVEEDAYERAGGVEAWVAASRTDSVDSSVDHSFGGGDDTDGLGPEAAGSEPGKRSGPPWLRAASFILLFAGGWAVGVAVDRGAGGLPTSELESELKAPDESAELGASVARDAMETFGSIGLETVWISEEVAGAASGLESGLLVLSVEEGAPAFSAGLRAGDRILDIEGRPVAGNVAWETVSETGGPVAIRWMRGDQRLQGEIR